MKEIPLSRGMVALVDDDDYERVAGLGKWCASVRAHTSYALRGVARPDGTRTSIHMHSFITGWSYVDHVDGDGLNNTRANLRPATRSENAMNSRRRTDNKSGYRGVSWSKTNDKWRAVIKLAGRRIHLGYFHDPREAAAAYDAAARDLHGSFATLNFATEIAA